MEFGNRLRCNLIKKHRCDSDLNLAMDTVSNRIGCFFELVSPGEHALDCIPKSPALDCRYKPSTASNKEWKTHRSLKFLDQARDARLREGKLLCSTCYRPDTQGSAKCFQLPQVHYGLVNT